jgi:hypothetical protein
MCRGIEILLAKSSKSVSVDIVGPSPAVKEENMRAVILWAATPRGEKRVSRLTRHQLKVREDCLFVGIRAGWPGPCQPAKSRHHHRIVARQAHGTCRHDPGRRPGSSTSSGATVPRVACAGAGPSQTRPRSSSGAHARRRPVVWLRGARPRLPARRRGAPLRVPVRAGPSS